MIRQLTICCRTSDFAEKNLTVTEKLLSYVNSFRKNTVKASEGSGSAADRAPLAGLMKRPRQSGGGIKERSRTFLPDSAMFDVLLPPYCISPSPSHITPILMKTG